MKKYFYVDDKLVKTVTEDRLLDLKGKGKNLSGAFLYLTKITTFGIFIIPNIE